MDYHVNAQTSLDNQSAYIFRRSVLRNCREADIEALLDLADDLHDLIRLRRSQASRDAKGGAPKGPFVTQSAVFLD